MVTAKMKYCKNLKAENKDIGSILFLNVHFYYLYITVNTFLLALLIHIFVFYKIEAFKSLTYRDTLKFNNQWLLKYYLILLNCYKCDSALVLSVKKKGLVQLK